MRRIRGNREASMNLKFLKLTIDDCKKMRVCIHCGSYNGIVKKKPNEALKILHEKFKVQKESEMDDLIRQFEYSCSINPEIENKIKDFSEDLDPLKV